MILTGIDILIIKRFVGVHLVQERSVLNRAQNDSPAGISSNN